MTNRLDQETSPYLLQHHENPVDWWPWSDEALDEARRRGVPIFLSIGYSACHWCHVMAHESFEDATIAMTGHGGWPMSVLLDLEARPFYAGTYFPPEPRHQGSRLGCRMGRRQLIARVRAVAGSSRRYRDIPRTMRGSAACRRGVRGVGC